MPEIRTRDEALIAVEGALATWQTDSIGVLTRATAIANAAQGQAAAAVRRWAVRVSALEAALAALREGGDPRPIEAELAMARESLCQATGAAHQIDAATERLATLQRTHARGVETQVAGARADLRRRTAQLSAYRGPGGGGGGVASPVSAAPAPSADWLTTRGLAEVDPATVDFSDNPILGEFGRGGLTRADYRWAVQTWEEVVRPGVQRGLGRDDFAARDAERGVPLNRQTASVFDMLLGDPIGLVRVADGTLHIDTGGRHRLEVAKELGIQSLPAKVIDSDRTY